MIDSDRTMAVVMINQVPQTQ